MDIRFTRHALLRMKRRSITKDEVINTIQYPEKTTTSERNLCAKKDIGRAKIEVIYSKDKYINVITVYYI